MLGVISDTHDNLRAVDKFVEIFKEKEIREILHLGDFISPFTLKKFQNFKLYGVFGNNDGEKLMLKDVANSLGFLLEEPPFELELWGKKFLLLHGYGSRERTRRIVDTFAKSEEYDFILYGHIHQVDIRRIGSTFILNPGEACGYLFGKNTAAILDPENYRVEILHL
ncbi:YfcE family phosphodiesterase [Euryarchaeota archaeon ex4484_178]|nr:MAG: YfcE family phosphodiesterase [Euryarchaeota archaeon ex4484_178]